MSKKNRLANTSNRFQGPFRKVLCVCSAGLLRSPTIAWVLSQAPYNCNTRAAGIVDEYALIPMDDVLLEWADIIVCAEQEHQPSETDKPVYVLDVEDNFEHRSAHLIREILAALDRVNFPTDKENHRRTS